MALKKDRIEIFPSRNGQWSFRYKRKNGKKLATAGETYHNYKDAVVTTHYLFGDQIRSGIAEVVTLDSHRSPKKK